jgi:hypothetical protein
MSRPFALAAFVCFPGLLAGPAPGTRAQSDDDHIRRGEEEASVRTVIEFRMLKDGEGFRSAQLCLWDEAAADALIKKLDKTTGTGGDKPRGGDTRVRGAGATEKATLKGHAYLEKEQKRSMVQLRVMAEAVGQGGGCGG